MAPAPDRDPRDVGSQRVYVGVVGLAVVFLLTLLAASVLSMLGQDPRPAPAAGNAAVAHRDDAPKEPLAELGVAPGNGPKPPAPRPQPQVAPRRP